MQKKSYNTPDKTMAPPKTKIEIVNVDGGTIARSTFEPGWKWSEHIKSTADTKTCQIHHLLSVISGRLKVVMDDGTEMEISPGDVADIPAGHDAWVVGDEPVIGIDAGGLIAAKDWKI